MVSLLFVASLSGLGGSTLGGVRILERCPNLLFAFVQGNRVSSVGDTRILWLSGGQAPAGTNLGFPDNKVITSKYTLWNFLAKNLFEQFRRIANFYFLVMSIVALSIDSPVRPFTSICPLVFVISVSMLKQGYEDFLRHRADKDVNNTPVTVLRNSGLQFIKSQKVRVGDILVVRREEDVPCDMVLLASSDPDGRAYITTANLDGESNLKLLFCPRLLRYFSQPEQLSELCARIECEHPNPDLYHFYGKIEIFPTEGSLYTKLLDDDPQVPRGLEGGALLVESSEDSGTSRVSLMAMPVPSSQSTASRLFRRAASREADESRNAFPDPLRPRAFVSEDTVTWAPPIMTFEDAIKKGKRIARIKSGLIGPSFQHTLAYGETVTGGVRSLKRVGLLKTPAEGGSLAGSIMDRRSSTLIWTRPRDHPPAAEPQPSTSREPNEAVPVDSSTASAKQRKSHRPKDSIGSTVPVKYPSFGLSAPLGTDNMLLRGTRLRNTEFVYGCAVYTGLETKLALNSRLTGNKFSSVEKTVNKFLVFFLLLLLLEVLISVTLKHAMEIHHSDDMQYYLGEVFDSKTMSIVSDLLSFIILYNYIIPISLYVTIEMQKFLGTFFFEWDEEMYDKEMKQAPICNTSDLNEELGQVEVLFTDKTGTLTENLMVFRRCSVAGKAYSELNGRLKLLGADMDEEKGKFVPTLTPELEELFLALALCHTLQVDANNTDVDAKDEMPLYQAASPDEKALGEAAARLGFVFLGEEGDFVSVKVKGAVRRWRKLDVLEFTSERKRMSVVAEDESGRTHLYCKGAESAVLPLVDSGPKHQTLAHLNDFAMRGLRTLVVGVRELHALELMTLGSDVEVARQTVSSRRESLVAAAYERMEKGLRLLGATAVEDRLQDGVQETLESLRAAGISVWILTGDKVETAVNISFSCGHFKNGTEQIYLTEHRDPTKCRLALERFRDRVRSDRDRQYGMVVDGPSLALSLQHPDLLREVCLACYAVVCCRMSPLQKCEVVQMVKAGATHPVTAAIGDGANDVSMIQEAHVGLGVMGREGRQAARCADFAFARFKFLRRALLVHGHWYYERLATLVQYFFYKNIIFITPQLYYAFYSFYSASALYDSLFLMAYNVLFTSLPILLYGLLEQVFREPVLMAFPQLYSRISHNALLSWTRFIEWMLFGFWHSLVLFFLPILLLSHNSTFHYNGLPLEFKDFGTQLYHNIVVVANLKLLLHSGYWTYAFVCSIVLSIVGFMTVAVIYCSVIITIFGPEMYLVYIYMLMSPSFWLLSVLTITVCFIPDTVFMVVKKYPLIEGFRKTFQKCQRRRNR